MSPTICSVQTLYLTQSKSTLKATMGLLCVCMCVCIEHALRMITRHHLWCTGSTCRRQIHWEWQWLSDPRLLLHPMGSKPWGNRFSRQHASEGHPCFQSSAIHWMIAQPYSSGYRSGTPINAQTLFPICTVAETLCCTVLMSAERSLNAVDLFNSRAVASESNLFVCLVCTCVMQDAALEVQRIRCSALM